jgi:hypothetical protein
MKNAKSMYFKQLLLSGLLLGFLTGCEREVSDDVAFATLSNNPDVFIDGFSGGLEYLPFNGSRLDAFKVDTEVKYQGEASMRFDVPNFGDPQGAFAGAIFPDNGGRDLSGYDALTFWAKATKAATINEIGFGNDFGENKFLVTKTNLRISTGWNKYVIPIPDPSRLIAEKGMFWYSEGPEDGDGYTFWIDELKFEKLGTVAQPQPAIFNGEDLVAQSFQDIESTIPRAGLTQTFNLASGINQTVVAAPSYFTFDSSDPEVARVNELGVITNAKVGSATITATLAGVRAKGSLTLEVGGPFEFAPVPPQRNPEDVVSVFSDAYASAAIEYFNGFFTPDGQTTLGGNIDINGDNIIVYSDLNFVALKTLNTVNASAMTHYHVDLRVEDAQLEPGDFIRVLLLDAGPDGSVGTADDTEASVEFRSPVLVAGEWVSLDIPLTDFAGLNRSNLSLFFLVSDSTVSEVLVDNMYFYR